MFSNHNWIKLEIIKKRILEKLTNMWMLNNILLNNWWVQEEITKEIRKYAVINENTTYRNLWDAAQKKIYS